MPVVLKLIIRNSDVPTIPSEPLEQAVQFQVVSASCTCVVFRPDDSMRVSAGYGDGTIRTFDLASVSMICKMAPHRQAISALRYSQNGELSDFIVH